MSLKFANFSKQGGFTILEAVLVLSLLTIFLVQSIPYQQKKQSEKRQVYAVRGLNAIAQASIAHYVDEDQTWHNTWPADVATLAARGYLPIFNNRNGFGGGFEICPNGCLSGMTISTTVETVFHARSIQALWGPSASVTGTTVIIGIPIPGQESSHLALLDLAGTREITGTVEFGSGADIDLQQNNVVGGDIAEFNELDASNEAGTGVINSNNINGDIVTAEEFYYAPSN